MAILKNPNIAKANPGVAANASFINALYKEQYNRNATKAELDKFVGRTVKDAANLILGAAKSPFINKAPAPAPTPAPIPAAPAPIPVAQLPAGAVKIQTPAELAGKTENDIIRTDRGIYTNPTPSLPSPSAPTPAPTPAPTTNQQAPTPAAGLQEPYKSMYEEAKKLLDSLQKRGQVVSADIVITPEKAAEFMTQAQNEINPYYATEFAKAKTAFLQAQGYDQADLDKFEIDMERKYGFNQKNVAASAAERGFAQSGIRQQEEQNLAYDTQRALEANRTNLGRRQQELAQAFAGTYGGKNTPGALNISEAPIVGVEGFIKPAKEKPLYQLSPDLYQNLIGSQQYAETAANKARASQLESAFRENEALKQNRALTL